MVTCDIYFNERADMSVIDVGSEAPAFELTNQDRESVALSSYAGKFVLLWWYPKADTPG